MSLNTFGILNIVAYFINKANKYCYVVLGLHKVISKHSNKNMAVVLLNIFKDYRIYNNIRYFIANNAELNNIYINAIL